MRDNLLQLTNSLRRPNKPKMRADLPDRLLHRQHHKILRNWVFQRPVRRRPHLQLLHTLQITVLRRPHRPHMHPILHPRLIRPRLQPELRNLLHLPLLRRHRLQALRPSLPPLLLLRHPHPKMLIHLHLRHRIPRQLHQKLRE
jgi:hypothetical protein